METPLKAPTPLFLKPNSLKLGGLKEVKKMPKCSSVDCRKYLPSIPGCKDKTCMYDEATKCRLPTTLEELTKLAKNLPKHSGKMKKWRLKR
jgi:hypothetical protein